MSDQPVNWSINQPVHQSAQPIIQSINHYIRGGGIFRKEYLRGAYSRGFNEGVGL